MDGFEDNRRVCVSELVLTNDDSDIEDREGNLQTCNSDASRKSPILGHFYKLPDLPESIEPDPPKLDNSLPYIPVYTHLKTFDLAPIERPNTPPIIHKLRSSCGSMQSKNRSKSRSTAVVNERSNEAGDQADQAVNYSGRIAKYEDSEGTLQEEST